MTSCSQERPDAGTDGIQLFDLESGPRETRDLSADPACAPHVERLAARLTAWQREVEDPMAGVPVLPAAPLGPRSDTAQAVSRRDGGPTGDL